MRIELSKIKKPNNNRPHQPHKRIELGAVAITRNITKSCTRKGNSQGYICERIAVILEGKEYQEWEK